MPPSTWVSEPGAGLGTLAQDPAAIFLGKLPRSAVRAISAAAVDALRRAFLEGAGEAQQRSVDLWLAAGPDCGRGG
jgi:hypothetical protein